MFSAARHRARANTLYPAYCSTTRCRKICRWQVPALNATAGSDEEYLACFIDCVINGSADPENVARPKVRAALRHSPKLAARIAASRSEVPTGALIWKPEDGRIRNVIVKLARGHIAHQHAESQLDEPAHVAFKPLSVLPDDERSAFESVPDSPRTAGWPEIGSRAFVNLIVGGDKTYDVDSGWHILQKGRYRYMVPDADTVRIVLSEYLAAEVCW